jgi:tetratricopeptide (TPR) repeat protein
MTFEQGWNVCLNTYVLVSRRLRGGLGRSRRESNYSTMKTLYDLLGALPDDDADGLRTAFRNAVKATHPDIKTDDPDAALRFRQIVRANAILSDPEQRATYDRLLALTLRQPDPKSKRSSSGTIRKLASDAVAVALLSTVSIGGYLLFEQFSKAPVTPVKATQVAARAPAEIAAVIAAEPVDTTARDRPRDKVEDAGVVSDAIAPSAVVPAANPDTAQAIAHVDPVEIAAVTPTEQLDTPGRDEPQHKLEDAAVPDDAMLPSTIAPAANTDGGQVIANAGPAPDLSAHDAKSYRERGIFAYRDGDLHRAIADFDRAIQHDPGFADAYIDRGIVFYRMHEFGRAFADIAQAKRIENSNRARTAKTAPPAPHRATPSSARN